MSLYVRTTLMLEGKYNDVLIVKIWSILFLLIFDTWQFVMRFYFGAMEFQHICGTTGLLTEQSIG